MLNIFGRGKKVNKLEVKTPTQKINEAAIALVEQANIGQRGGRLVTKGAALEIVRRSVTKNSKATFSVQKFHALKEVSEYITLAQRNKVITASAAHFDLLPVGHPSSKREHGLSFEELMRARARWFASDARVVDDGVASLLATAFTSEFDSPEYLYASSRLTAMGATRVPLEALVAAAIGYNDGANRGFWRQQIRDRRGRWAKMFGMVRSLTRDTDGTVYPQYTQIVSTDSRNGIVRSMQPDGRLAETPAGSLDQEVKALIPGSETPNGISTTPAQYDSADPVTNIADIKYVSQPHGFDRKGAANIPNGIDASKIEDAWEDDLGNYQVLKGEFRDGEGSEFVVSRLEQDQVVPIAVGKNWLDAVRALDEDDDKFRDGEDAEPNLPEGFDISPAPREEMDINSLTPDELAAGYGWGKSGDKYERDNFEIEQLPNGKWLLTETGEEGAFRESGPFDSPAEAFEVGQIEAGGPEFDQGQVMDFREDQGPDEGDQGPDGPDTDFGPPIPGSYEDALERVKNAPAGSTVIQPETVGPNFRRFPPVTWTKDEDGTWRSRDGEELSNEEMAGFVSDESPTTGKEKLGGGWKLRTPRGGRPPEPDAPDGLYEVDRGPYAPKGPQEGVDSEDFTDDPVELAQRFDPEELEGSLEEAIRNGEGEALLPFDDGDEYVPAEALYNALKEQDRDPDQLLDGIYDGEDRTPETEEVVEEEEAPEDEEELGPITPEEVAEQRKEGELPALLDGLSDEELADVINNEDYRQYLPENEEFDVPEGMYEIDSDALDPTNNFAPADAPEGAPGTPIDMADQMSTEDLEAGLRGALEADENSERLGYYPIQVFDEDGEEFTYDVPAEAWRDALQLQGVDTNEILREAYDGGEMEPNEIEDAIEGEDIETEEVFGLSQEEKDKLIEATKEGGYTVNFVTGEVPTDGYMVASEADVPDGEGGFKKREEVVSREDFDADPIKYLDEFTSRNFDKLKEDGYYIGTWTSTITDEETGEEKEYVFFDVSERIEDKEEALQAARDRNEIAIFGIEEFEEFFTDPEREAQKNAGEEAPEGDDESSEQLPGDDGAGTPGVAEGDQPSDSGEPGQEQVGPIDGVYDISDWENVGPQAGSNAGGFYRDPQGNRYYVKFPQSEDHARNEATASALYEAAGLNVARVFLGTNDNGDLLLVSPLVDFDGELSNFLDNEDVLDSAKRGFVVDAWLNNWDAVGLVYDNMLVKDNEVIRIDPGGSLFYRAQGGDKDLPEDVRLIDTLRNPDVNEQSASVFGDMTDEELTESARLVQAVTPEQIDSIVDEIYADDPERGEELKSALRARREWLMEEFELRETPTAPELEEEPVTDTEDPAAPESAEELPEGGFDVEVVPFGTNPPLPVDFDRDLAEQVEEALANSRELVFSYDGVDRLIRPLGAPETNENTGKTSFLAQDSEGNFKKFTLSKMAVASNADEIVGEDSPGDTIPVDDAEISPQQVQQTAKQVSNVVDTIFETDDVDTGNIEDASEADDAVDEVYVDAIQSIEAAEDAGPVPSTPEEKILADTVQALVEGDTKIPSTVDDIVNAAQGADALEPDIIWADIVKSYDGKVLENGHIVVSSVMHGDRRYDVVVRRQNDNTFHVYHRVTYPDGSTKVREMGNKGWHSTTALFDRIDTQIFNSKNSPKTTVNKNLKPENNKTLYSDTSKPVQPGSYVDANNNVVSINDRVVVTNSSHSKFGMGARVVDTVRILKGKDTAKSKIYSYTDYLRVQYDDGEYNLIRSQSTTLGNTDQLTDDALDKLRQKLTGGENVQSVASNQAPEVKSSFATSTVQYKDLGFLPGGAVLRRVSDGVLYRMVDGGYLFEKGNGVGGTAVSFPNSESFQIVSFDPTYDNPGGSNYFEVGDETLAKGEPLSGSPVTKNADFSLDYFNNDDEKLMKELAGSARSFVGSSGKAQYSADSLEQVEEYIQLAFGSAAEDEIPFLPTDRTGRKKVVPGSIVFFGEDNQVAFVTEIREYKFNDGSEGSGRVDIAILSGPNAGKEWVGVDSVELLSTDKYYHKGFAEHYFNLEYDKSFFATVKNGRDEALMPSDYKSPEMVTGAGAEFPQSEGSADWSQSFADTNSVSDIMNKLRNVGVTGAKTAGDGFYTLVDSGAIEDQQVRFQRVVNRNGDVEIRITGKLTSWAGIELMQRLAQEGGYDATQGVRLDSFDSDAEGNLQTTKKVDTRNIDREEKGTTYTWGTDRGNLTLFRAISEQQEQEIDSPDFELSFFRNPTNYRHPVTFHNLFDIRLPENASTGDIERALEGLGVENVRPATEADARILAENKLMWNFGKLTDGNVNPSGELRRQKLADIEKEWKVTADDITFEVDMTNQGRVNMLLPESVAEAILRRTDTPRYVYHHINLGDAYYTDEDSAAEAFANILESGRLDSTLNRWISGNFVEGDSSSEDVFGPGANYVFLHPNNQFDNETETDRGEIALDAVQLFRRFDFYANEGDGWGALQGRAADSIKALGNGSSGEVMFKSNIDLWALMIGMGLDADVRNKLIEVLKSRGVDELGERTVEAVLGTNIDQYNHRNL